MQSEPYNDALDMWADLALIAEEWAKAEAPTPFELIRKREDQFGWVDGGRQIRFGSVVVCWVDEVEGYTVRLASFHGSWVE